MTKCLLAAALALLALLPATAAETTLNYQACGLNVKYDKARDLDSWKPQIAQYSARHYGENDWQLQPMAVVLHYTAGSGFPWNLVTSRDFLGETPGLASHYVVDGATVWQILPPWVRSRGAYGINHRAINIEMVALNAPDLAHRGQTLKTAARLSWCLMQHYGISDQKLYSHQQVGSMNPKLVPEALDKLAPEPYGKPDPGEGNMQTIRKLIAGLRGQS